MDEMYWKLRNDVYSIDSLTGFLKELDKVAPTSLKNALTDEFKNQFRDSGSTNFTESIFTFQTKIDQVQQSFLVIETKTNKENQNLIKDLFFRLARVSTLLIFERWFDEFGSN